MPTRARTRGICFLCGISTVFCISISIAKSSFIEVPLFTQPIHPADNAQVINNNPLLPSPIEMRHRLTPHRYPFGQRVTKDDKRVASDEKGGGDDDNQEVLILSSAHGSPQSTPHPNSSNLSYEIRLKSALSVSLPSIPSSSPSPLREENNSVNKSLPLKSPLPEPSKTPAPLNQGNNQESIVSSPDATHSTEIIAASIPFPSKKNSSLDLTPSESKKSSRSKHNPKGLITAIALILANSLANGDFSRGGFTNVSEAFPLVPSSVNSTSITNITKGLYDDLMTSESNIISSSAVNVANWFRNIISGSKWKKNRDTDKNYYGSHVAQSSHNYAQGIPPPPTPSSVPPPFHPDHFLQHILPSPPEGFPLHTSPYHTGNTVVIPPEALQDTGIMYWLNFIEQAAQQSQNDHPMGTRPSEEEIRPLKIGEKPLRTGPNSIRDELIMDEGEEGGDDSSNYERANRRKPTTPRPSSGSASQDESSSTDTVHASDNAPRCDKFTSTICVDDFEYPEQAIVDEIYKRREIFELMYSDDAPLSKSSLVDGIPRDVEESYVYDSYETGRDSNSEAASSISSSKDNGGYVCPSEVLYGRPKLAKSMSGEWKVIVNAGEFTQTLRMEKCLKPNARCNYIVPHLETRCAQVHAVHRLMVFEKGRGFFVESFKIPTGCNCQIVRSKVQLSGNPTVHAPAMTATSSSMNHQKVLNLGDLGHHLLQHQQSLPADTVASFLASNRHRYKNPSASPQQQLNQQLHIQQLLNLIQQSQQSQQSSHKNHGGQGQISRDVWSLLLGSADAGSASPHSLEEALLHHLQTKVPSSVPSDVVLQQLVGEQQLHHRHVVNNRNSPTIKHTTTGSVRDKNSFGSNVAAPPPILPSTTTIVHPSGSVNGGQPLVQVIHVPVTSGSYHPPPHHHSHSTHYKTSSSGRHPSVLTAYDSNSSGTIYTAEEYNNNNETTVTDYNRNNNTSTHPVVDENGDHAEIPFMSPSFSPSSSSDNSNDSSLPVYSLPPDLLPRRRNNDSFPHHAQDNNNDEEMVSGGAPFDDETAIGIDDKEEGSSSSTHSIHSSVKPHPHLSTVTGREKQVTGTSRWNEKHLEHMEDDMMKVSRLANQTVDRLTEEDKKNQKTQSGKTNKDISGDGDEDINSDNSKDNNSVTKRILSQKMNFNYHPILEYISLPPSPVN